LGVLYCTVEILLWQGWLNLLGRISRCANVCTLCILHASIARDIRIHFLVYVLNYVLSLFQSVGTENCSQYFSKDVSRDGKAQTVQQPFTIYHDHLQPLASELSASTGSTAVTSPEEMELHPSVTAAFVPETFHVRSEIFDDINSTGWNHSLNLYLYCFIL